MDEKKLAKHWGMILLRGIVAILFGILALAATGITLDVLLMILGIYLLIDGGVTIIAGIVASHHKHWWTLVIEGLITVLFGIMILAWPGITLTILVYLVAIWAIVTGLFEFVAGLSASWAVPGKVFIAVVGVLSIILGIVMFAAPGIAINAIMWLIGIYAIVIGFSLVFFAFRIKPTK